MKTFWSFTLLLILTINAASANEPDRPLQITVFSAPQSVLIDGKPIAYYELHLTNVSGDTLQLTSVTVSSAKLKLQDLSGEALKKASTASTLAPRSSAVLYLEVPVGSNRALTHTIQFTKRQTGKHATGTTRYTTQTSKAIPPTLGAPLREGTWAAIYEPVWTRGHRRVIFTKDGVDYIPGRYAIDFMRLDSVGHYATGYEDSIANWYGYNNAVYAVANGTVVATRTDFTESPLVSIESTAGPMDGSGNYVALEIGNEQIVFYEHLKPGSITVKPGQRVNEGEVIGAVGFTGHSTGPHLHFHVATRKLPLWAHGTPYVFRDFWLMGRYPDFNVFGKSTWQNETIKHIKKERPAPNTVIRFAP